MKLSVLCLLLSVVAGCARGPLSNDYCALSSAHRFSHATQDVMTDAEIEQELKHNSYGERACGWKKS